MQCSVGASDGWPCGGEGGAGEVAESCRRWGAADDVAGARAQETTARGGVSGWWHQTEWLGRPGVKRNTCLVESLSGSKPSSPTTHTRQQWRQDAACGHVGAAVLTESKTGRLARHPAGAQLPKLGEGRVDLAVGDACRGGRSARRGGLAALAAVCAPSRGGRPLATRCRRGHTANRAGASLGRCEGSGAVQACACADQSRHRALCGAAALARFPYDERTCRQPADPEFPRHVARCCGRWSPEGAAGLGLWRSSTNGWDAPRRVAISAVRASGRTDDPPPRPSCCAWRLLPSSLSLPPPPLTRDFCVS